MIKNLLAYGTGLEMNQKIQQFLESLIPFFMVGIAIALLIGLFIMFSYVLIWGLFIGSILWAITSIKTYLFRHHHRKVVMKSDGRIIEHNDKE